MDVARFNFSHGDYEEQKNRMNLLKNVREELDRPVAILLDTKGPEIRTGVLEGGQKVTLKEGETFTLYIEECVGNEGKEIRLFFEAEIPPFGYSTYCIKKKEAGKKEVSETAKSV